MRNQSFPSWVNVLLEQADRAKIVAPLDRVVTDDKEVMGIRKADSYDLKNDDLKQLASSMNNGGQLKMLSDLQVVLTDDGEALRTLGGNRRATAARWLLNQKLIPANTTVTCWLILTTNRKEQIRVACEDNGFRVNLDDIERYHMVKLMLMRGFSVEEAAASLGQDKRTVERFEDISGYPFLESLLEAGMPYSKLATIAEKLNDKPKIRDGTMAFLENWYKTEVPKRREVIKAENARKDKSTKETSLVLGKLFNPGEWEGWIRDLENGSIPTGNVRVPKVKVETEGSKIKLSGINIDTNELSSRQIAEILLTVEADAVTALKKALKKKRAEESVGDDDDADELRDRLAHQYGVMASEEDDDEAGVRANDDLAQPDDPDDDASGFDADAT